MPHIPSPAARALVVHAQQLLRLDQSELAELLHVSRRTVQRLAGPAGTLHAGYMHVLARAVHPHDPVLAGSLAAEGGQTLENLGIVQPPPPPPPPPSAPVPEPPPPRPRPPTRLMVESIVCAAAETMQTPPAAVRDVLRSAFARARGLGLTVEEVDEALSPPEPGPAAAQARKARVRA